LAEQVKEVEEVNRGLKENDFYRNVLLAGIRGIADLSTLGLTYLADGDRQAPEVFLHSETAVYDLTERYGRAIRQMAEGEMKA
jgi:hypothetical protein